MSKIQPNIFDKLALELYRAGIPASNQRDSIDWFRLRIKAMKKKHAPETVTEHLASRSKSIAGSMYFWHYDPKHKKTLPYYDGFPCGIIIEPKAGATGEPGFLGLNLHYLPPILRAKLLGNLTDIASDRRFDSNTKFQISYALLKEASALKEFRPCIKHYLGSHVQGNFAYVNPADWSKAVFLPVAIWNKRNAQKVYADSRKKI